MPRLLGFAPDAEVRTEGALLSCSNLVPTRKGFASVRALNSLGASALENPPLGVGSVSTSLGRFVYAATADKIYQYAEPSWQWVSRSTPYIAARRWMFTNFGDVALAASGVNKIQSLPAVTGQYLDHFDDIPEAPKAKIIVVSNGFVLAFNIEGTPDGWACSALYDHITWVPNAAKQSANGRLLDSMGEIVAALPLGDGVAVYKKNVVYLATYVGAPSQNIIWAFERVSREAGALSSTSVADIGGKHFVVGQNDFWIFDGSRPYRLEAPVKEWFFRRLNKKKADLVVCFFDETTRCVYISFCDKTLSETNNTTLVYHIDTQHWGKMDFGSNVSGAFHSLGITYDALGQRFPVYNDITADVFDEIGFSEVFSSSKFFNADNVLCDMSGAPLDSKLETWVAGDYSDISRVLRVLPEFTIAPQASRLTHLYADHPTKPFRSFNEAGLVNGLYYTNLSSRWHQFKIATKGLFEITSLELDAIFSGRN